MTPDPLTDSEERLLRAAVAQGVHLHGDVPAWQAAERERLGTELAELLSAWENMSEEARDTITAALTDRTGAEIESAADLGDAIRERLDLIRHRAAPRVPGLFEAVEALHGIWVARGGRTGGNLHRDRAEGKADHPMLTFIAAHALAYLPAIGDNARSPTQRLHNATRRVESQLKELRAQGDWRGGTSKSGQFGKRGSSPG